MTQRALAELLHGKGAHADPIACVEDLSAELAARRVEGFPHSVGQLVFHMNYWMDYELRRIRGETPKYPEHSLESFPAAALPGDPKQAARIFRMMARAGFSSRVIVQLLRNWQVEDETLSALEQESEMAALSPPDLAPPEDAEP